MSKPKMYPEWEKPKRYSDTFEAQLEDFQKEVRDFKRLLVSEINALFDMIARRK